MSDVLFICVANPGRSVMAEQIFNRTAGGRLYATLAGSEPGTAAHPAVIEALAEIGIDASDHRSSTPTRSRASMQWFRRAVKKPVP